MLEEIQKKMAEQAYHIEVLKLWDVVRKAGYEPEEVSSFTYVDSFLCHWHEQDNRVAKRNKRNPKYSGATHHNAVRLKIDQIVKIPMTVRPTPPEHTKVTITK